MGHPVDISSDKKPVTRYIQISESQVAVAKFQSSKRGDVRPELVVGTIANTDSSVSGHLFFSTIYRPSEFSHSSPNN